MNWKPCPVLTPGDAASAKTVVAPGLLDRAGMTLSRARPSTAVRMVGSFDFCGRTGPAKELTDAGLGTHPTARTHRATEIDRLEREMRERDGPGTGQAIRPGDETGFIPLPDKTAARQGRRGGCSAGAEVRR